VQAQRQAGVRAAQGLPCRLLRPPQRALPAGSGRRRPGRTDPRRAHRIEGPLWRPQGARRAAPPRPPAWAQAGGPADAPDRNQGPRGQAVEEDHDRGPGRRSPGRPDPPRLHHRRPQGQLPLVRGHHLYRHLGRVAVPGHRDRYRLPPRRGICDGRSPAHQPDQRRARQRGRRPRPGPRRDLPLRQRLPVHLRRVHRSRGGLPSRALPGPHRPMLGQGLRFTLHLLARVGWELGF
jgi:hypothetical protein